MADLNKSEVIQLLVDEGIRIDLANQYADAFLEYMTSTQNIDEFGVIVIASQDWQPDRESLPGHSGPGTEKTAGDGDCAVRSAVE